MFDSLLQSVKASIDRNSSFSITRRALYVHLGTLFKHNLIRVIMLLMYSISVRFLCTTLVMLVNLPTSLAGGLSERRLTGMRTKRSNLVLVSSLHLFLTLIHLSIWNLWTILLWWIRILLWLVPLTSLSQFHHQKNSVFVADSIGQSYWRCVHQDRSCLLSLVIHSRTTLCKLLFSVFTCLGWSYAISSVAYHYILHLS